MDWTAADTMPSSPPSEQATTKSKARVIIRADSTQTALLKKAFSSSIPKGVLSSEQLNVLCEQTNLPPKWISNWFSRERTKFKSKSASESTSKQKPKRDSKAPLTSSALQNTSLTRDEIRNIKREASLDAGIPMSASADTTTDKDTCASSPSEPGSVSLSVSISGVSESTGMEMWSSSSNETIAHTRAALFFAQEDVRSVSVPGAGTDFGGANTMLIGPGLGLGPGFGFEDDFGSRDALALGERGDTLTQKRDSTNDLDRIEGGSPSYSQSRASQAESHVRLLRSSFKSGNDAHSESSTTATASGTTAKVAPPKTRGRKAKPKPQYTGVKVKGEIVEARLDTLALGGVSGVSASVIGSGMSRIPSVLRVVPETDTGILTGTTTSVSGVIGHTVQQSSGKTARGGVGSGSVVKQGQMQATLRQNLSMIAPPKRSPMTGGAARGAAANRLRANDASVTGNTVGPIRMSRKGRRAARSGLGKTSMIMGDEDLATSPEYGNAMGNVGYEYDLDRGFLTTSGGGYVRSDWASATSSTGAIATSAAGSSTSTGVGSTGIMGNADTGKAEQRRALKMSRVRTRHGPVFHTQFHNNGPADYGFRVPGPSTSRTLSGAMDGDVSTGGFYDGSMISAGGGGAGCSAMGGSGGVQAHVLPALYTPQQQYPGLESFSMGSMVDDGGEIHGFYATHDVNTGAMTMTRPRPLAPAFDWENYHSVPSSAIVGGGSVGGTLENGGQWYCGDEMHVDQNHGEEYEAVSASCYNQTGYQSAMGNMVMSEYQPTPVDPTSGAQTVFHPSVLEYTLSPFDHAQYHTTAAHEYTQYREVLDPELAPLMHLQDVLQGFKDEKGDYGRLLLGEERGNVIACLLDERLVPFKAAMGLCLLYKLGLNVE